MTARFIRKLGDPILRATCHKVENITEILPLLDEMAEILQATPHGAALAAPQVGHTKRLVVIRTKTRLSKLINPEIVKEQGRQKGPESCLSLPGIVGIVTRSSYVTVKALNTDGHEITFRARGFLARCVQHEINHLNGILFIDHVLPGQIYDEYTKQPLDAAHLIEISNRSGKT